MWEVVFIRAKNNRDSLLLIWFGSAIFKRKNINCSQQGGMNRYNWNESNLIRNILGAPIKLQSEESSILWFISIEMNQRM